MKTIITKTFVLVLLLSFSSGLFAQIEKTSEESIIVMKKSELNSFLSNIADARRAELAKRESLQLHQELGELRLKYQQNNNNFNGVRGNASNQEIVRELRYLRQRIDNLDENNPNFTPKNRDDLTVIIPNNSGQNSGYSTNSASTAVPIPSNNKQISQLQATIDSLKSIDNTNYQTDKSNTFSDSLTIVNTRLANVRQQLEILELKMKADKAKKTELKPAAEKSYFKQQVYFENNSQVVQGEYDRYVQELTQILKQYPEAKILLEGWASPLGKPEYNKRLSMRRAEAVKKVFVNNNIEASRILTSFQGEDNISSEQHARRVDISVIVR